MSFSPVFRQRSFLLLLFVASAYGQRVRVGVIGGGDASRDFSEKYFPPTPMDPGGGYEQTSDVRSYLVGPTVQIQLRQRLALEIDALFKPLGFTDAAVLLDGSRRSVSPATVVTWQFPMLMKYQLRDGRISPFVSGGPSLRTSGNLNGTMPSKAGVTAGTGATIPWGSLRFEPTLRYTRWKADGLFGFTRTRSDQLEFLLGVTTGAPDSNWKPLGKRLSLGALAGTAVTDRLRRSAQERRSGQERRFLAGPQLGVSVRGPWSIQANAIYSPIGANVTWEFPLLVRYTAPLPQRSRLKPIFELGPTFRTPQEMSGLSLGRYGLATGGGVEVGIGTVRATTLVRFSHWTRESLPSRLSQYWPPGSIPSRSDVFRNQIQVLFGFSF